MAERTDILWELYSQTRVTSNAKMKRQVGGTYIHTLKSKQWPVVLCDDEVAPSQFIALRTDPNHIPAIQLGKHKFIFVHLAMLVDFDPHINYTPGLSPLAADEDQQDDSPEVKEEKQRRTAFREDAQKWQDHHFWANYIMNRSKARKLEHKSKRIDNSTRKRRRNGGSQPVINLERGSRPSTWSTSAKRQQSSHSKSLFPPITPRKASHKHISKHRQDSANDAIEISDDINDDDVSVGALIELDDPFRSKATERSIAPGPTQCKLLFPQGGTLLVERDMIANCPFLHSRCCGDAHATELDLTHDERANDVNLSPSDIHAAANYFRNRDLGPRLTNRPDEPPMVSQLDLTPRRKEAHAEALSKAFVAAVKIEDEALQELIYAKFLALYPLPPLSALIVARSVANLPGISTTAQNNLATWATDHLAQCFWALARDCGGVLQNLLEENEAMRTAVYDALKADSQAGKVDLD